MSVPEIIVYSSNFALIVVLFVLLIIVGTSFMSGGMY